MKTDGSMGRPSKSKMGRVSQESLINLLSKFWGFVLLVKERWVFMSFWNESLLFFAYIGLGYIFLVRDFMDILLGREIGCFSFSIKFLS